MDRTLRAGLVCVALAGCGTDSGAPVAPAASVRDSAGIVVVENAWAPLALEGVVTVDATSVLSVGGLDAPPDRQLDGVRGATVLPDGALALFDGGSHEVRIYGREGSLRARWGGEGEGPGEFGGAILLGRLPGDTLVVWDEGQRRLSLVDPAAGFVRSVTAENDAGGYPLGLGLLDGGWAVFGGGLYFSSADGGFPEGRIRSNSDYRTMNVDGRPGPAVGSFPGPEMFARASETSFSARGIPFGLTTVAATADSLVWIATGEAWELRGWAPGGTLRRIVRAEAPRAPVTDALVDAWIEDSLADVDPPDRPDRRRELADLPRGEAVPPFSSLVAGPEGEVWARDGTLPGADAVGWTVIGPDGTLVARLELPVRWRILEVGRSHVVVLDRDDLDVQQVRVHRVLRGG